MKLQITSILLVLSAAFLTGCSESKPAIVADPNAYAPYQASADELAAQQAQAAEEAGRPRR